MNFSDLAKYKGVLISAAVLIALVFISAFASNALQQKAKATDVLLAKLNAPALVEDGQFVSSSSIQQWQSDLSAAELALLNEADATNAASLISAITSNNAADFNQSKTALTQAAQRLSEKRNNLVFIAPIAVVVLALLVYFLGLIPQLLRLTQDKEVQVESNQQAENILNTVSEGLFLLDKEGQIGVEQSASLKDMFRLKRDLEGSFLDFIGQYVPESSVSVAKDYLDLLYGDRVKEKLVKDLNPLNQVEINIARRDGSLESRFLDFKFARVMVEGKLQHLLGSITDVTREVQLQKELEANKEQQEAQLDLLMSILHIDKQSLSRFYEETERSLDEINGVLQERGHTDQNIRSKLVNMAEKAHRIKGDAAALKLNSFEFVVHEFESELATLMNTKESISGRDLLPAVEKLKTVFNELNDMQSIVSRFEDVLSVEQGRDNTGAAAVTGQTAPASPAPSAPTGLVAELEQLTNTLAERAEVRVVLKTFGLGEDEIPSDLVTVVRDTSIQMLRNSVAHAARPAAQRLAAGKPDYLTVTISLTKTDEGHTLLIRDDGEGLDKEKIVQKAFAQGLIKTEDSNAVPANMLGRIIFHPGFSSKDAPDMDSGRGMGLSAVHSMVREVGGTLGFSQAEGKFSQFSFRFK